MKHIRLVLEDEEYKTIMVKKGKLTWREWLNRKDQGGI